jgi:hypothetical protein
MANDEPKPPRRWRKRLLALAVGLLALEIALPFVAARVPLASRLYLPPPLFILGAASKDGLVPDDYVLVLGDSYAAGSGDWLIGALAEEGNPAFQATDILHERLGRDVINFGKGGADSVTATAMVVSKRFAQLRRNGLGEPDDVVVYFYEGNDLNDNLRRARRDFGLKERAIDSYTDADLDRLIDERATAGFWKGLPGMLYAPYVVQKALQRQADAADVADGDGGASKSGLRRLASEVIGAEDDTTCVAVGDARYGFDQPIQGPALELTDEELDLTLRMFAGSLRWVKRRFDGPSLTVVYLPSPLACYDITSPEVRAQSYEGRGERFDAERVVERSDALRARVGAAAAALGMTFIDATPALRERAHHEPVHGPIDGGHLNRAGYEVLGELLVSRFEAN